MRGVGNKIRVYELAKELGLSSKEVTERLAKGGFSVTSASSSVDEGRARAALSKGAPPKDKGPKRVTKAEVPAKAKPAQRVKEVVETKLSPEPTVAPKPTPPPAKPAPAPAPPRRETPPPAPKREAPPAPRVHPERPRVDAPRPAPPVA